MRTWLMLCLAGIAALSGCTDDAEDSTPEDDLMEEEMMQSEPVNVTLEYSFGESLGCTGDITGTCIGMQTGQDGVDGFFVALEEGHVGLSFTSTAGNVLGDSDCFLLDESGAIVGDANNGEGPCQGEIPSGATQMFLYSYGEPSTGMTLTFTAPGA